MKNYIYLLLTLSLSIGVSSCNSDSSKASLKDFATRDVGGADGYQKLKDDRGFVYAEGLLENKTRKGEWKFYVSPASREANKPDVVGSYDELGNKDGAWIHSNTKTGINVKATYNKGLMTGECAYYDDNNALLAIGAVQNGVRNGKWIFYDEGSASTGGFHKDGFKLNNKMTEGIYENGIRKGSWAYDYFLDKNTHVKGELSFENGVNNGRLEFYKIERHEKFGTSETLSGIGTFKNNKKTGRWVVFNYGTKGDFVETGNYNDNGNRDGLWQIKIGDQTHLSGTYNNGIPHGKSLQYYENGQIKYETTFNNGMEEGAFKSYYKNGQVKDQGTHVIVNGETTKDTVFFSLKLPYEHHFMLVEQDFANMNYDYITWLEEPGYSIAPDELTRRFELYKSYGKEPNRRIEDIKIINKKVMCEGEYLAFYEDGSLHLKGQHTPGYVSLFDPFQHKITQDFARAGEWKEYEPNKMLKCTYIYDNGKLTKMLDANGYVEHSFKYEANGSVSMIDKEGHSTSYK